MADLPEDRVDSTPLFTYCGMDCFGPFTVKEKKKGTEEIRSDIHLHEFSCSAHRAVR